MIARTWRGRATPPNAVLYHAHFTSRVLPALASLPGHRGAKLLQRSVDGLVELVAITLWDSEAVIAAFAGPDIRRAHVEPEARAILAAFDDHADHYEVVAAEPPG